jgi:hypothetical protein
MDKYSKLCVGVPLRKRVSIEGFDGRLIVRGSLSANRRKDNERSGYEQNGFESTVVTRKKHLAVPEWNRQIKRSKRPSCILWKIPRLVPHLLAPYLKISLHKTICDMNDDLLGELRIAHADRVDDTLMVCDLRHPRTRVKTLSQSAHQRECI